MLLVLVFAWERTWWENNKDLEGCHSMAQLRYHEVESADAESLGMANSVPLYLAAEETWREAFVGVT